MALDYDDNDVKNFIQLDNCAYGRFATEKNAHKFCPNRVNCRPSLEHASHARSMLLDSLRFVVLQTIDEQRTVFAIRLW